MTLSIRLCAADPLIQYMFSFIRPSIIMCVSSAADSTLGTNSRKRRAGAINNPIIIITATVNVIQSGAAHQPNISLSVFSSLGMQMQQKTNLICCIHHLRCCLLS